SCHAAKTLDEIESHPFGGENGTARAGDFENGSVHRNALTVGSQARKRDRGRKLEKRFFGKLDSGQDQGLTCTHRRLDDRRLRDGGHGRDVAAADVLGQRGAHSSSYVLRAERLHGGRMMKKTGDVKGSETRRRFQWAS